MYCSGEGFGRFFQLFISHTLQIVDLMEMYFIPKKLIRWIDLLWKALDLPPPPLYVLVLLRVEMFVGNCKDG